MSQPLPVNPYAAGSTHSAAYIVCLDTERSAPEALVQQYGPSRLVCARLLGYMLLNAPVETGRDNVANEISSCGNNSELRQLASLYINNLLRCFKAAKGRTPSTSEHPSRPSFDNVRETLDYLLVKAPPTHRTAKNKALIRDGFRCVITREFDLTSFKTNVPGAAEAYATDPASDVRPTQLAHIFPPSTNLGLGSELESSNQHRYAVIERFSLVNGFLELNGPNMHRLENVMTLTPSLHSMFDSLDIWFQATPIVNHYVLCSTYPAFLNGLPATVTFTSPSPLLPVPDPRYLALHAACARVAHLSGAAEYIEDMHRRLEDTTVLASNGSSADTLSFALENVFTAAA